MTNKNTKVAGITFSEDEIQAMKSGATVSKAGKEGSANSQVETTITQDGVQIQTGTVSTSGGWGSKAPDISVRVGDIKVTQPKIRDKDGNVLEQKKVITPNVDRHNKAAAARHLARLEEDDRLRAEREAARPEALLNNVEAQGRQLRKQAKEIAELKKLVKELSGGGAVS